MTLTTLDWALAYQNHGFAVYPMVPGGDGSPKGTHVFNSASTDPQQAKDWWGQHPKWGIGLALIGTHILVLDIDQNHDSGSDGEATLVALYKRGAEFLPDDTYMERTPRGGAHIFMTYPGSLSLTKGTNLFSDHGEQTGIDYEAQGVPVAPTRRNGGCYKPAKGHKLTTIRPAPQWVLDGITAKKKPVELSGVRRSRRKTWSGRLLDDLVRGASKGQRNTYLTSVAGKLFFTGADAKTVYNLLAAANSFMDEPLPDEEVNTIFKSMLKREGEKYAS